MSNMSNKGLADRDHTFIEDVAGLLVPWGVPQTAARLYGYLLLRPEPASLDCIAAELEMSKSSASVAARLLEQYTLARRRGEAGSKRALYEASDNYEGIMTGQIRLVTALADLLCKRSEQGGPRERIAEMAEFYGMIGDATEQALRRWKARGED